MDQKLFLYINSLKKSNSKLFFLTQYLGDSSKKFYFIIFFLYCGHLFSINNYELIYNSSLILLFTIILTDTLKNTLKRARPTTIKTTYSLPSSHSVGSMTISLIIYYYNEYLGIGLIFIAILVGFSRILKEVHYPFDVIIGWIFSIVSFHFLNIIFN